MSERDPYTQEKFQDLQNERFGVSLKYFICVINEENHPHLVDASGFFENCILDQKIIRNPLTGNPISDFTILVSSKEDPTFQPYLSKEELLTPPNHLPIFWNDSRKPLAERIKFMLEYAQLFEKKQIEKTIETYEEAASHKSSEALLRLVRIYKTLEKKDLVINSINRALACSDLKIKDLFFCAHAAEDIESPETAFKAYVCAAQRKNLIAIGEVISQLESRQDSKEEVADWRSQLPLEWQSKPVSEFFDHLQAIGYTYDLEGYHSSSG